MSYFFITVAYILEGIILFQVLETFTGLRAYSTKRDDQKMVYMMPDICMTMMMQDDFLQTDYLEESASIFAGVKDGRQGN